MLVTFSDGLKIIYRTSTAKETRVENARSIIFHENNKRNSNEIKTDLPATDSELKVIENELYFSVDDQKSGRKSLFLKTISENSKNKDDLANIPADYLFSGDCSKIDFLIKKIRYGVFCLSNPPEISIFPMKVIDQDSFTDLMIYKKPQSANLFFFSYSKNFSG